ncbi:hypothetical protein GSS87_06865 [Corynebacterium sp. 4HC-13]|uniref:hypothetical protein n=1 Tax=Corynebacterium anserum TaxID=2684406 RepID=UPI001639D6E7|nr:hypothetical protein [Corynebacterium anserum]MBC2682115.1 hypothetical protein [Corynebacterium anserum]
MNTSATQKAQKTQNAPLSMKGTSPVGSGSQFLRSLKSEWVKNVTVRRTWVWCVLFLGSLFGPVTLMALFKSGDTVTFQWPDIATGASIFLLLSVVYGASSTAQEINSKMNAHAFLTQKGRWQWLTARYVLLVVMLLVLWGGGVAIAWLIASVAPGTEFVGGSFTAMWANAIAMPVYALIGAGVAALTRNRVAGLTLPLVWILVIENILLAFQSKYTWVEFLYHWSPGHVVNDITLSEQGLMPGGSVSIGHSLTVLALWLIVSVVIGLVSNQKRDIQ